MKVENEIIGICDTVVRMWIVIDGVVMSDGGGSGDGEVFLFLSLPPNYILYFHRFKL